MKNRVRQKNNAVLVFKKTVLDRIPRYKRTALKEEWLYIESGILELTFFLINLDAFYTAFYLRPSNFQDAQQVPKLSRGPQHSLWHCRKAFQSCILTICVLHLITLQRLSQEIYYFYPSQTPPLPFRVCWFYTYSNFSYRFINPNCFFQFELELVQCTVVPQIVSSLEQFPTFNSFRGNYLIYEVNNCHNAETI